MNSVDYSNEQHFVQSFIRKNRRERMLYELTTPEKRYDGVSRFCHSAKDLLDPAKIVMEGDGIDRHPYFIDFTARHNEICYVLSPESGGEDLFFTLKNALDYAAKGLDAVIIIGNCFAVVFGEPSKNGRDMFLLSEKKEKYI